MKTIRKYSLVCTVANPGCKENTKAECFCCGQPVCVNCSKRRTYYDYGRVRLCDGCQEIYDDKVFFVLNLGA